MITTNKIDVDRGQHLELRWLPYMNRKILVRSMIIAMVLGSLLTLINQSGWVAGNDPLQQLQLMLVFLIPFTVVTASQVAGRRRAAIDSTVRAMPASPESFLITALSHGIPARALGIGLVIGGLNMLIVMADALLRSGDLTAVSVVPLGQAYLLPFVFGALSQAISYRRFRYQTVNA